MYTISQIQNATLEQVRNDPNLLKAVVGLYGYNGDPQRMLNYWESGYRSFNADKSYAIGNLQAGSLRAMETYGYADKYSNWNNPNNPTDMARAETQRQKGLQLLAEFRTRMESLGIDYSGYQPYQQYYDLFTNGMTAQQRALYDQQGLNYLDPNVQPTTTNNGSGGQPPAINIPFKSGLTQAQRDSITALAQKPISQWNQNDRDNWNYATNNAPLPNQGQTTTNQQTTTNIPFRSGLTQAQKDSITALAQKPIDQWNQNDRDNWNYATNNAPLPNSSNTNNNTTNNTTNNNTTNNNTTTTNNIPFKDGLTQAQKDSITALAQKPFDQWNDNDKANWNYATNNAPFPNGGGGSGNNTTNNNTTNNTTNQNGTVNSADQKWINDLYQKYFDRTATSAEINNWLSANPQALEQFLAAEQKKYGYVSTAMGAERKARYDAAMKIINESNLPEEIKALWRNTVGLYPDATDFKPQEILDTFNKIKNETIDPYFKELSDVAINDLKTSFASLQDNRAMELETERANAGESIRQAKAGLEKSGMTFTGQGIENLGASSAYAQNNTDGTSSTPTQIPFAGLDNVFYEGKVNQANRLLSSSSAARYSLAQQNLGRQAESLIGSTGVMNALPGLQYTPSGTNLTGQYQTQKDARYGSTLEQILQNWRSSQKLSTNI